MMIEETIIKSIFNHHPRGKIHVGRPRKRRTEALSDSYHNLQCQKKKNNMKSSSRGLI
jgi:hypothetical protein